MEYTIITSENFQPADWSGGKTTELFIFPSTADYQRRDFQFRLSSSAVEIDKSDFTLLDGFSRKLLVLDGEVTLIHEGHYSRHLKKFEVDAFEGEWKTSSIGKCVDFNLMTKSNVAGEIAVRSIEKEKHFISVAKENCDWNFIYVFSGKVNIVLNDAIRTIMKGDLLIINKLTAGNFEITGLEKSELVFSHISL